MNNLEKMIESAMENLNEDRSIAYQFLLELKTYIEEDLTGKRKKSTGAIVAKYLESISKTNEQLVKLIAIISKEKKDDGEELSEEDIEGVYNKINSEEKS